MAITIIFICLKTHFNFFLLPIPQPLSLPTCFIGETSLIINTMDTEKIKELQNETGVVLVEFYASWCPHCQKMMPIVADVKALYEGKVPVYQFDIDENQELADSFNVKSIPTFIIFDKGEIVWRSAGEMTADQLSSEVEKALSK